MADRKISTPLGSQGDAVPLGGPGSGNWGHAGRKGKRGGSLPRWSAMSVKSGKTAQIRQVVARSGARLPSKLSDDPTERAGQVRKAFAQMAEAEGRLKAITSDAGQKLREVSNARQRAFSAAVDWDAPVAEINAVQDRINAEWATRYNGALEDWRAKDAAYNEVRNGRVARARELLLAAAPDTPAKSFKWEAVEPRNITMRSQVMKNAQVAADFVNGLVRSRSVASEVGMPAMLRIKKGSVRASCRENDVKCDRKTSVRTLVHEFGHFIEHYSPVPFAHAVAFLRSRTQGEKLVSLSAATGNSGYRPNEQTRPDRFLSAYVGKHYAHGSTEVLSMGLEYLYAEPLWFATQDPGHFDATLTAIWTYDANR